VQVRGRALMEVLPVERARALISFLRQPCSTRPCMPFSAGHRRWRRLRQAGAAALAAIAAAAAAVAIAVTAMATATPVAATPVAAALVALPPPRLHRTTSTAPLPQHQLPRFSHPTPRPRSPCREWRPCQRTSWRASPACRWSLRSRCCRQGTRR